MEGPFAYCSNASSPFSSTNAYRYKITKLGLVEAA